MISPVLQRLEKALGDDRGIPIHRFILCRNGIYYATDGRICVSLPVPARTLLSTAMPTGNDFCVRGDLLIKAAKLPGAHISGRTAERLTVSYRPRGRTVLKLADDPFPEIGQPLDNALSVPPDFLAIVKLLAPFRGDGAVSLWNANIFFTERYAFACNSAEAARFDYQQSPLFTISPWAVSFLQAQEVPPQRVVIGERLTTFLWEDGMVMHARNTEDATAPAGIHAIVDNIPDAATPVSDDLRQAVERMRAAGAKYMTAAPDAVRASLDAEEMVEEIDGGANWGGLWDIEKVGRALKNATRIDLASTHRATWTADNMRGLFMGMRG